MKVNTGVFFFLAFIITEALGQSDKFDQIFQGYDSIRPGVSVVLVQDDQVVYNRSFGYANLEHNIPITGNTVFPVASVSKQFTGLGVAHLIESGQLSIDTEVRTVIGELPDYGEKITIGQLLNHTSGIRDYIELFLLAGFDFYDTKTQERALSIICNQKDLSFKPGSRYEYSNSGYVLLAEVVKRVVGRDFAEFIEDSIFKKAEMPNTLIRKDPKQIIMQLASSYESQDNKSFFWSPFTESVLGATGVYSTSRDFGNYIRYLNKLNKSESELIKRINRASSDGKAYDVEYSYGWVVDNFNGLRRLSHSGRNASFLSYLAWFPSNGVGIAILSNNYPHGDPVALAEKVLSEYFKVKLGIETQKDFNLIKASLEKQIITLRKEDLEKYQGSYWQKEGNYIRSIRLRNGELFYVRNQSSESKLSPIGNGKFLMMGVHALLVVEFVKTSKGDHTMLVKVNDEPSTEYLLSELPPGGQSLTEYAGTFLSDDLGVVYELYTVNDQLLVSVTGHPPKVLNPTIKDHFNGGSPWWLGYDLEFKRKNGKIIGFMVQQFHVKNMWFHKLESAPRY